MIVGVHGVSFVPGYPANVAKIELLWGRREFFGDGGGLPAELVRRPDNPVDPNAIEVWSSGVMVGHLPAGLARRLAPQLDRGDEWEARIVAVRTHEEHPDRPGVDVDVRRLNAEMVR